MGYGGTLVQSHRLSQHRMYQTPAKRLQLTPSEWEFNFYNIVFGLFQAPYYAVGRSLNGPSVSVSIAFNTLPVRSNYDQRADASWLR